MPLSEEIIRELIGLEEQVLTRVYDSTTLPRIIRTYGLLVEHYDALRDPIKYYFLEKMQATLSLPESLK